MNQKLSQLFQNIAQIEPTSGLEAAIFRRIEAEEAKKIQRKLAFFRLILISSALTTLVAVITLGNELLHSEFMSMLSLVFSDLNVVVQNWYAFGLSLMETFPTMTAIVILAPMFALFLSASSYLELNRHYHKYV